MTATALAIPEPRAALDLHVLADRAETFAEGALSASTRRAYRSKLRALDAWAAARGIATMPIDPAALALFVTELADRGRTVSTISGVIAAVTRRHRDAGFSRPLDSPHLARVLEGIRRELGTAQVRKSALLADDLRTICGTLEPVGGPAAARDAALLLVGFAGAFRRSELAALELRDLRFVADGAEITLRRSKVDQIGAGATKVIARGALRATCPVRALETWIAIAGIVDARAPIFRSVDRGRIGTTPLSGESIAKIVKKRAAAIGLDASSFSGHSLRSGFVTEADARGISEADTLRVTLHASSAMLARYRRPRSMWTNPASARLGL